MRFIISGHITNYNDPKNIFVSDFETSEIQK